MNSFIKPKTIKSGVKNFYAVHKIEKMGFGTLKVQPNIGSGSIYRKQTTQLGNHFELEEYHWENPGWDEDGRRLSEIGKKIQDGRRLSDEN